MSRQFEKDELKLMVAGIAAIVMIVSFIWLIVGDSIGPLIWFCVAFFIWYGMHS